MADIKNIHVVYRGRFFINAHNMLNINLINGLRLETVKFHSKLTLGT
ncbi:hypothetical protein NTGBS_790052 [Candidatus Nitrotoga sp. BS]|nr:hypothetical protein NTGBS_790052 [Candidatus Nitrotoga sp. BS]